MQYPGDYPQAKLGITYELALLLWTGGLFFRRSQEPYH